MATTRINQSDLKFYPSERLDDTDEGGGMPLGTPIKGVAGEIFTPISSIARTNGDFDNVLLYGGVQRSDNEPLIGSFVALTKPPTDPNVSYLLFGANFGELRKDGVKRIENYSTATIESPMTLLSNPSKGSKIVQAYQRVGEKLPSIGDVYCLRQEKQGYTKAEQYIQLVKIEATERTFTGADGREFVRMVVKMEISQALNHDFIGADYPSEHYIDNPCKIRETHVADAATYHGIKPLAQKADKGASSVKITSIMEKIVPTAQMEMPIIDASASRFAPMIVDVGATAIFIGGMFDLSRENTYYLRPFVPNSLNLGGVTDNGGKLIYEGTQIGTADYATGTLVITSPIGKAVSQASLRPAVTITPLQDSYRIDVNLQNRSYNYIHTVPNVGVGSLTVAYMAQGKWYELSDNGSGVLVGQAQAHGSGTVNYRTGTVSLTCGLMPDVGSSILFNVGNQAKITALTDTPQVYYGYDCKALPLTVTLGGKTQKANKLGKLAGNLTGHYDNGLQKLFVSPDGLSFKPNGQASYNTGNRQVVTITAPSRDGDGNVTLNLSDHALTAGTVEMLYAVKYTKDGVTHELVKRLYDDGNGKLIDSAGREIGMVDYATATAKFNPRAKATNDELVPKYRTETYTVRKGGRLFGPKYVTHTRQVIDGYTAAQVDTEFALDGIVQASFYDNATNAQQQINLSSDELMILLKQHKDARFSIVAGSVMFALGNDMYYDRAGVIYKLSDVSTGNGKRVGVIDYKTGVVTVQDFDRTEFKLLCSATSLNIQTMDEISFRTPTAPIRLSSLQLRATLLDGTEISVTADTDGNLDGEWVTGRVDAKYGVVTASFGKLVDASMVESESWYNANLVQDGKIWKPAQVIADSIIYNAVGISHLPINSTAVKIDTVRLPTDGLIPIFRRGDTVLIGSRKTQDLGSAHLGGQTVMLERQNLDRICITDKNDKPVFADLWDYDLDAGSITWKTPLDLSAYTMPLKAMHAKEEKNRVVGVDIDGRLSLMFGLKHDYDVGDTHVSSVLIGGDLQVRHSIPFTQTNWDNVWRDTVNGNELLNRLNLRDYPMKLTDDGAVSERWLIRFVNGSQFELYGESLGFVLRADTLQDLAPINPATNKPYFTIPKEAFGGAQGQAPWQTQNVIRFNTTGTLLPFWVIRSVQPNSDTQTGDDGFTMCLFGDTTEI